MFLFELLGPECRAFQGQPTFLSISVSVILTHSTAGIIIACSFFCTRHTRRCKDRPRLRLSTIRSSAFLLRKPSLPAGVPQLRISSCVSVWSLSSLILPFPSTSVMNGAESSCCRSRSDLLVNILGRTCVENLPIDHVSSFVPPHNWRFPLPSRAHDCTSCSVGAFPGCFLLSVLPGTHRPFLPK